MCVGVRGCRDGDHAGDVARQLVSRSAQGRKHLLLSEERSRCKLGMRGARLVLIDCAVHVNTYDNGVS